MDGGMKLRRGSSKLKLQFATYCLLQQTQRVNREIFVVSQL